MPPTETNARITISKDGPYLAVGDVFLATQTIMTDAEGGSGAWQEGEAIPHPVSYALCRCGASRTKPFRDGAHLKIGFDGTETASRESYLDQASVLDGPVLQLTDAESLCAFARFFDPHGQVWSQVTSTDDPDHRRYVHAATVVDHRCARLRIRSVNRQRLPGCSSIFELALLRCWSVR